MSDVFISYSRLDRPAAEVISKAIEARGWSVWWDRKIGAGESFDKTIERELESAKCVIVLWSKSSVESDWVKNEAAAAVERNSLIPVLIEGVRLPLEFRRKQTIDLSGWDKTSSDPTLALLMNPIAERLSGSVSTPSSMPDAPKAKRGLSRTTRLSLASAGAALVAAVAIAVGVQLMHTDSTDFTLVCKGGGPFGIRTHGFFTVRIAFERGRGPAAESLEAGQCAWTDRAVNEREPTEMCYSGMFTSFLSKRFAANELVRQQAHYEAANSCLRITNLL
jgi:TIR domain